MAALSSSSSSPSKKKSGWSLKGTMNRLLTRTDIPVNVTTKPGHTVKTKNIVYMSGPSTWKARVKAKADTDSTLVLSPPPPPPPPLSNGLSNGDSASVLMVANGTMQVQRASPRDPNGSNNVRVTHNGGIVNGAVTMTSPTTLPKPTVNRQQKKRETYRNYVYINDYGNGQTSPPPSSSSASPRSPYTPSPPISPSQPPVVHFHMTANDISPQPQKQQQQQQNQRK